MATIKNKNKGKIIALGTGAIVLIIFIAFFLFNYINGLKTDNSQKNLATEIAYVGQGLLRTSGTVIDKYNEDNYRQLTEGRNKLNLSIDLLSKGGVLSNGVEVPPPTEFLSGQIMAFQSVINDMIVNINYILNEKNDIIILKEKKEKYEKLNAKLLESLSGLASGSNELKVTSGNVSSYLSIIGNTYNQLNSVNVKYFADDKNALNEDYLAEQNNILQIINQQVNEIARLSEVAKDFNMTTTAKNNLLSELNKTYSIAQEMKLESNAIMELLPKVNTAKKYAAQMDKLSVRLDDAYTSLAFSLSTTQNNSSIWLILFIIFDFLLIIDVFYLVSFSGKSSNVIESRRGEQKLREVIKSVLDLLDQFMFEGKLKRDIVLNANGLSATNKLPLILQKLSSIASSMNSEKSEHNSFLREFNSDINNLMENLSNTILSDEEFSKKIDILLPLLDNVRLTLNEMYQFSETINIDDTKNNIEYSNERINTTIQGFNNLKENMQETNKSIKLISENSQGLTENTEEIKNAIDKLQINALNTEVITDVIIDKVSNDAEIYEKALNINSYIKNVKEISSFIATVVARIENSNLITLEGSAEAIRSNEENIREIVEGGEAISKIQNSLVSISEDLNSISVNSTQISSKTEEAVKQLEMANKEFKNSKMENRESIENKNKILLKIKALCEKVAERIVK